jgi:aspartyl-tRNA(Asn)/glutamyl-tRNA(Gln) amidotransferase subunit B
MKKGKLDNPVIGLEIHAELATNSKMFCNCPADHFGKKPNTQTCPVCLGLPGALPVPNKKAVDWAIMIGLALNCKINKTSKFDRKHYFYPDLPKGFQISQYDRPFCIKGYLDTDEGKVRITRVHLEEDTGKLQHRKIKGEEVSLVDFNRSGVPLVEIVTEPDIHSAAQAKEFAQKLQQIIRFIGVSDCDMEKGSMRLEANTSWGMDMGYKVEVKNLNSFRFVEQAINYDLDRQKKLLDKGKTPRQETRGWDEKRDKTVTQRYKETAADYRYFPEPDIPPIKFDNNYIEKLKKSLPKLPKDYVKRFVEKYSLREGYANILTSNKSMAEFALSLLETARKKGIMTEVAAGYLVNKKPDIAKLKPSDIIRKIEKEKENLVSDISSLEGLSKQAIKELPQAVKDYKSGKENAISALIGKVMQLSKGKADASKVRVILEKILKT